jgi:phosphoglucosamine mutase
MVRRYFGTDGIRGLANKVITPELALKVGQAAGIIFRNGDHRHRVLIGKDTRLSGYMIETALVAGFTSVGMDVLLTGPIPTPGVGMLVRSMRADIGVMISASHNPYDDNGIKLFGPDGFKLSDDVERQIEDLLDSDLSKQLAKGDELGRAKRIDGVQDRYIEFAKRTLPRDIDLAGLRVVVDCANGAAYKVAPGALWELGADVIAIGDEPNGFNINKDCGSTDLAAISKKVREMRADIGIALDGDADRVMIIDENGKVVDGDQLLAVIAESWQADGRLSKPGVRWPRRRVADAGGGQAPQQAGVGIVPPLRAAAADIEERALQGRQADGEFCRHYRDRQRREEARPGRPIAGAAVRHRAGHPRHGRG